MAKIREQHIAVFGESGSGKTVLVSAFYGPSQEPQYSDSWDLIAEDVGLGLRLHQNYLGMRDDAAAPIQNRFAATTYSFRVQMKGGGEATKHAFDGLRLVWHDYPGEWFTEEPSIEEEKRRRVDTFGALLHSDVALLLVDGQKLLAHQGEEELYLKPLLNTFRQALLGLKEDLLAGEGRRDEFPRIWIIALSKADLFPVGFDVHAFRDLVVRKAAPDIEHLRETLKDFAVAPEALAMGQDFMVLSSAKFSLTSATTEPVVIDVSKRFGLNLILPVALLLPLERRAQWQEKLQLSRKALDSMADGAEDLAEVLLNAQGSLLMKMAFRVPKYGKLAKRVAIPALMKAAKIAGSQLKQVNEEAKKNHDHLAATLTQFKLDLEQGETDKLLIRSKS